MRDAEEATSEFIKACCSALYGSELVPLLLGGRLHPGGDELTRRLAGLTGVGPGDRVLDVASGRGSTARLLAAERGATVHGVELSPRLVMLAERETAEAGQEDLASFELGDAERLPVDDASFDVVLCECALCTFPDQAAAAAGFRHVLAPGGRLGIADVTLERDRLPAELDTPIGRVACIAGALPGSEYERLLFASGFVDVEVESRPDAALATVDHIRDWLGAAGEPRGLFDLGTVLRLVDLVRRCVLEGVIGYALITARIPEAPEDADAVAGVGRADGPLR